MSVGVFLGIRPSYPAGYESSAERFIANINTALRSVGLGEYREPPTPIDPYVDGHFGRSSLDHNSAGAIEAVAGCCPEQVACANLGLLGTNPYRVAFLPIPLLTPIETDYTEMISGEPTKIWVGSLFGLSDDLRRVGEVLGIPVADGEVNDVVARALDDFLPLSDECDPGDCNVWLMLHEGCRLARSFNVALSFAG